MANLAKLYKRARSSYAPTPTCSKARSLSTTSPTTDSSTTPLSVLQTEIAPAQIQQLKTFHREFFDESNSGQRSQGCGRTIFADKLRADIEALKVIRAKGRMPTPSSASSAEPIARLEEWAGKPFALYLTELILLQGRLARRQGRLLRPHSQIRGRIRGQGLPGSSGSFIIRQPRKPTLPFPVQEATLKAFARQRLPPSGAPLLAEAKVHRRKTQGRSRPTTIRHPQRC